MALKIQTVDESINANGLKCLVYGLLGTGKTTLCATPAAQGKKVLIGNAEGGLLSLKDLDASTKANIDVAQLQSFGDVGLLYEHLTEAEEPLYDWVCLDSISEIAEVVLTNEKQNTNDGRAAYGNLADIMMGMLRSFRDIPNYNVCMSAKMTRFEDEVTNRTMFWPLMPGKTLTNGIGYLFDEVFAMRVESDEEGNQHRWLQTQRDIQYEAKDRSNRLEMFEPPDLNLIEEKINSGLPVEDEDETTVNENNEEDNENGEAA